ncbi:hypothetical protein DHD32_17855 [Arenibacter sp. TNZ]|uniref:VCBS repeat-containing protein n=1 Tax=Arenibacter TaxID=178469 RepID=UPI000CD47A8B|nr:MULTISPECIES: FG-GAP-like repeat-containing protein [Arenibacter]MCM4173344.1 hypothetical protein [Arenibacter sp. TNZ]
MLFLKYTLLICLVVLSVLSCSDVNNKDNSEHDQHSDSLFSIISPENSQINFKNILKETTTMNGLFYEYYYNGGGVSAGDLNNDGLVDIYFISNLNSNKLYLNKGDMKFEDVTDIANLEGKYGFPTGVTFVDINGDGKLDIYISKSGKFSDPDKRRNELYINKGNNSEGIPVFEENAREYGLDLPHFSTQASFFDYDKDGDLDMFLINHGITLYPDQVIEEYLKTESEYRGERLFQNNNGKFKDVTKEAGIINNMLGYGLGIAIGDLDNDNWPDIIVGHDYSEKDHMYLNQRDGTFKEVILQTTSHISNFSMGNDIADFNNDGLFDFISLDMMSEHNFDIKTSMSGMNPSRFYKHVDLGLHHQYMYNALQINNGIHGTLPRFSDIAQLSGVSSTDWSWGPLFFDMDNDGFKDLFISNGIKGDFRNNDFINYRKQQQEKIIQFKKDGKTFDQKAFIDDIMAHMPKRKKENYFYKNNGDLTFSSIGLNNKDVIPTSSNGAAYADLDNDGDVDLVVNNSDDFSFIYKNNSVEQGLGHYLKIKLKGPEKNRFGIGARIVLSTEKRNQYLEQYLTRGFQSSVSEILHFGLGKANQIDLLKVIWPDGKVQSLKDLKANQLITLDYKDAILGKDTPEKNSKLFLDATHEAKIDYRHIENHYDDFEKEILLPHKMSNFGPGIAIGDVNKDGLDDFYVGGAKGYSGELYLQNNKGTFSKQPNETWKKDAVSEDIGATFFDADADGDLDLYVVSGGNEFEPSDKRLQDRLYINDGHGIFNKTGNSLPKMITSGSIVKPFDFDGDGDIDLFVGGRLVPGNYPLPSRSYLLKNESKNSTIVFTDATQELLPELSDLGMITDAEWVDVNGDNIKDLVVVGEWTPIFIFENTTNGFKNITDYSGLSNKTGWWYSIASADMDNDGDMDLIAGNLGTNYKYKASSDAPFEVYSADFDKNGTTDIVLSYFDLGKAYPLRGRSCSSEQMPFIKDKFPTYNAFGAATLGEVYGEDLQNSLHYSATTFATSYLENIGGGKFEVIPLPNEAQYSSSNKILLDDFNGDGLNDILLAGNLYSSEIETPRNDAAFGLLLIGNGKGHFTPSPGYKNGLYISGDVKSMEPIQLDQNRTKGIIVGKNNDAMQLFKLLK